MTSRHEAPAILIDENVRARILRHHPDPGPAWLAELPGLIAKYCSHWQLTLVKPAFSEGAAGWAAPVELTDGTTAVLKLGVPRHERIDLRAAWQAYDPRSMARLLAHDPGDNASLIELCEPGQPAVSLPAAATDDIAAELLPRLWAPAPELELPGLSQIAAARAIRVRERADRLGIALYNTCGDLFDELASTCPDDCLLHGDFHPRNVLLSSRGWLAIDPRPILGEPAYDVAIHFHNRIHLDPDPVSRTTRLAERVAVPPRRALLWLAAKLIQLCSWFRVTGEIDQARVREPTAQRLVDAL